MEQINNKLIQDIVLPGCCAGLKTVNNNRMKQYGSLITKVNHMYRLGITNL